MTNTVFSSALLKLCVSPLLLVHLHLDRLNFQLYALARLLPAVRTLDLFVLAGRRIQPLRTGLTLLRSRDIDTAAVQASIRFQSM